MNKSPLECYVEERGLEDDPFFRNVIVHIGNHPLFSHRFFRAFLSGGLTIEQVRTWAKQRTFSSQAFTRFLGAFISTVEDRSIRAAYVKQMYEEEGCLDPDKVHSQQLIWLAFALGVSRQELAEEQPLPGTRCFMDAYMRISLEGDVLKGMGAYALGSDPVIALEMGLCMQGLRTIPWLTAYDVRYCADHVAHDYRHTVELCDVLLPHLRTDADRALAWQGMTEILDARHGFYDAIAERIGI